MSVKCRKEKMCTVPECLGKYHTLLHSWMPTSTVIQPSVNCATANGSHVKTCLGIIPVKIAYNDGNLLQIYIYLDNGANKTLCDHRLLQKIRCQGKQITFQISTFNSLGKDVHG